MGGANIIRSQSEQAAKDVYYGDYGPTALNVRGAGGLTFDAAGNPRFTGGYAGDVGGQYMGLFRQMAPQVQGMQNIPTEFAGRAASTSAGLFDQLNSFDPISAASERFGALKDILAPQQEAQRTAMQAQLLRQGRLGGTSGNAMEAAQQAAQHAADVQLANQLYGEAEQSKRNILADAMAAGQQATSTYGGLFGQLQALGQGAGAGSAQELANMQGLFNLAQAPGNARLQQDLARTGALNAYNTAIAGSSGASRGTFGQMAPGLVTGALSAAGNYFAPGSGAVLSNLMGSGGSAPAPTQQQLSMFGAPPGW